MRRLLTLIRSEFQLVFSSPAAWIFYLALPLLFTFAIGAGLKGLISPGTAATPRPTVYVTHLPQNEIGLTLRNLLQEQADLQEVDRLPRGKFGLDVPPDLMERLSSGAQVTVTLVLDPQSALTMAVEQAVQVALGRIGGAALVAQLGQAQLQAMASTPDLEQAFFTRVLTRTLAAVEPAPVVIRVTGPEGGTPQASAGPNSAQQASAGQLITWTLISLLGAAEVFVAERLRGTWQRLLLTPTSRLTLLSGKLLGRWLLGLIQIALLMIAGELLAHVGWSRSPLAALLVSLSFALAGVSLGMLLATLLRTRAQASGLVIGLSMALAALGGAWFPLEITPPLFQRLALLFPTTWTMQAYTAILTRGASVRQVLPAIGALLGFSLLYFSLAGWSMQHQSS